MKKQFRMEDRPGRIDTAVRDLMEEFGGRFELLTERAYTTATSIDLFYDVRDTLSGSEFRLIAGTRLALDMRALTADIRRQLRQRVQQIA